MSSIGSNKPPTSSDEQRQQQLQALNQLFAAILPGNKFYQAKLNAAGYNGVPFQSLEAFVESMPFTIKAEIIADQTAFPPYGTNLTHPIYQYTRYHQTSGTSGTPIRWLDTDESWEWLLNNWIRILQSAGVGKGDSVFYAFSFGPFLGFWTAFEAAVRIGCLNIPGGGLSTEGRLKGMLSFGATILCCTPTYAIRLGEAMSNYLESSEGGAEISKLKTIIVAGEPGGSIPATRAHLQSLWPGVRIFDHHGMTEVGPVSYESPNHPGIIHVLESAYFAEIIDPAGGQEVQQGESGELVLTTLGRTASPLIRYRTGDLVREAGPLDDRARLKRYGTLDLPLAGGILGRVDDMVTIRGVNLYPAAIEAVLRSFGSVREYQAEIRSVRGMEELSIKVELEADTPGQLVRDQIQSALRTAFNLRIPVEAVAAGLLPRFEMKASRWKKLD